MKRIVLAIALSLSLDVGAAVYELKDVTFDTGEQVTGYFVMDGRFDESIPSAWDIQGTRHFGAETWQDGSPAYFSHVYFDAEHHPIIVISGAAAAGIVLTPLIDASADIPIGAQLPLLLRC